MREFVALIRQDPDDGYRVSFPDFPVIMVVGETLEHVRAQAEVALLIHIGRLVSEGKGIPEPTDFEDIIADPRHQGALETVIVALVEIDLNGDDDEDDCHRWALKPRRP